MESADYINGEVEGPGGQGYMMPVDGEVSNIGNSLMEDFSVEQDSYGENMGETSAVADVRNSEDKNEYIESSEPRQRADAAANGVSPYRRSHMYEELPSTTGYANGLYEYNGPDGVTSPRQISMNSQLPLLDETSAWEGVGSGVRESNRSSSPGTAGVSSWIRPASSCRSSQHQPLLLRETGPGYRKRINPLYSSSHTLDKHSQHSKTSNRNLSLCVVFLSLVAAFLSVVACIIAGLSLNHHSSCASLGEDDNVVKQLLKRMEKLEEQQMLILKLNATRLDDNDDDVDSGLSMLTSISESVTGLKSELMILSNSVTSRLQNISLTAGPQGPSGAGNLSGCRQQYSSSGGPAVPDRASNTDWICDSVFEQQGKVITGITCSTKGGTQALLVSDDQPCGSSSSGRQLPGYHRYRCNCAGVYEHAVDRFCIIYYWTCPLLS